MIHPLNSLWRLEVMRLKRSIYAVLTTLTASAPIYADVKPHPLFTDNMVLQRDAELTVWGKADPGEKVTVTLAGGASPASVAETNASENGIWKATLPKQNAGTDLTLTLQGKNKITLKNVAVGEVWLCSGQSNMEWRLSQLTREDQGKKVAAAATNPNIRLFDVPNRPFPEPQSDFPQTDKQGCWLECKPETVINFSAVGYFFGRDIQKSQKVPVGLIASDWGGTPAEAWTSLGGLKTESGLSHYVDQYTKLVGSFDPAKAESKYQTDLENYKKAAAKAQAEGKPAPRAPSKPGVGGVNQNTPSALYNGMIAPLLPFAIKGAIWYQGESNAGRAYEYRTLFPAMISDWRKQWGYDFPFICVQLAPFRGNVQSGVDYAELRDAQFHATKKLPKVGIAIITDVGDETDIHPQQKEPVGQRLALSARSIAYGEAIESSGPTYKSHQLNGEKITIQFDHTAGGLMAKGDSLTGFAVCGEDKVFHPAQAAIDGNTVVVACEQVKQPIAVRYGWVNFAKPTLNFFNKAGLPAVPFRTDDFPYTTQPKN